MLKLAIVDKKRAIHLLKKKGLDQYAKLSQELKLDQNIRNVIYNMVKNGKTKIISDISFIKYIAQLNPKTLSNLCDELKKDENAAAIAIAVDGANIKYFIEPTENITISAIKQNHRACCYIDKKYLRDMKFCLKLLEIDNRFYPCLPIAIKNKLNLEHKTFPLEDYFYDNLDYIKSFLYNNWYRMDYVLAALKINPKIAAKLPNKVVKNDEYMKYMINENSNFNSAIYNATLKSIESGNYRIPAILANYEPFIIDAIKIDFRVLDKFGWAIQENKKYQLLAARHKKYYTLYCKKYEKDTMKLASHNRILFENVPYNNNDCLFEITN